MVTFNFTYDSGVTVQQALGFEMAGRIWSNYLADPVTLNIHIGMSSSLPTNVIGGALPGALANVQISGFRDRLAQDATSNNDQTAVAQFAGNAEFDVILDGTHRSLSSSQSSFNVMRATAKAVGMVSATDASLDGAIVMSTLGNSHLHWNYDFTRSSSAPQGSLDFLSVALHEIGHIFGFVSGVDKQGLRSNVISSSELSTYSQYLMDRMRFVTPLDAFRVDQFSDRDFTYGGGTRGFALQPASGMIAQFSTGKNRTFSGDGYQASHWKEQANALGIMDPAIAPRERVSISNLDLQAFDVIGWNLRNGLSASPFTTASLNNFRNQAVQGLAQRLGRTTTWVNNNLSAVPTNLGSDRTLAVAAMILNSGLYEWGTTGSGTTSNGGRRWMEIFNQMANNQEVYVNFSTVSNVSPNSEVPDPPSLNWGHNGSGKTSPGGRVWQENPTSSNESSSDEILGIDEMAALVSLDASDSLTSNPSPEGAIASIPSTSNDTWTGTTWTPVSTQATASTTTNMSMPVDGTSSQQQSMSLFATGLNTLLGVDSNPLIQTNLSAGLMGAIV